ncbi:protein N-terminal asparagine amidohydrolase isoform X1 [Periophthalmus magnuspinnatus]|uniref:N-terminal asparagine amidase n=1 Tax=Periophthalmus magnuspinnatus TaxID=409849 RepID=A0A3B3ZW91_9GOBI|nr:protein N-terminal asparagine amidohydrolase isoform X1 [Periophthalmus magnuspinnatus]
MPLLIQNKGLDRIRSTGDLYERYSHLQENARQFRSRPLVDVDPKCFLYVQQREYAATTPADQYVSVIGSDDATTCHLVALRHTGSGAACVAHLDGSNTWAEVQLIIKAVMSLSHHCKDGRLELHLVGGFNDDSKTSDNLSLNILAAFHKQKENVHLETCCITEMNDTVVNGTHRPAVYGIGMNVKTGDVFPSLFTCKGPAEELRSARTFTGGQMAEVYDSSRGLVKIGPCEWSPNLEIGFWLAQNDATILKYLSTSPKAEPPHFVQHIKSTIQFILDHPNSESLFPSGQPQVYHRTEQGEWERTVPT